EGLKDDLEQMKKPVLQSVALWLLEGREKHEQRVYLAKYLLRIEIPPDILSQDDFLIDANNQYMEAMENFKQTHKAYKELTKGLPDPAPLQEKHEQLEEEIDVLNNLLQQNLDKSKDKQKFVLIKVIRQLEKPKK
ncbi:MAG: hypothetical protein EZS28_055365, partial [Streblomastix strix]